jgi:hypothetical protein
MQKEARQKKVSEDVDSWIAEDELPVRANLKVLSRFDDLYDDEHLTPGEAYQLMMEREHALILGIAQPKYEESWPPYESDDAISFVFSSSDYAKKMGKFNKYHWRIKKIYEKVQDLAQTYSCISNPEGKKNTYERFVALVEKEFKDEAQMIAEHYKKYSMYMWRVGTMRKIAKLNYHIRKCDEIWKQTAYLD